MVVRLKLVKFMWEGWELNMSGIDIYIYIYNVIYIYIYSFILYSKKSARWIN